MCVHIVSDIRGLSGLLSCCRSPRAPSSRRRTAARPPSRPRHTSRPRRLPSPPLHPLDSRRDPSPSPGPRYVGRFCSDACTVVPDTQIILDVCQVTATISASSTTTTTTSSAAVGAAAGKPTMPAAYAGQRQHCCPISWTRTVTTLYTGVCILTATRSFVDVIRCAEAGSGQGLHGQARVQGERPSIQRACGSKGRNVLVLSQSSAVQALT